MDQIYDTLQLLASSAEPSDLQLMNLILSDMPSIFDLSPDQSTIACILKGFCQKSHFRKAHWWLMLTHRSGMPCVPSLDQWHTLLSRCADAGDVRDMRATMRDMHTVGYTPNNFTYRLLIRAMMPTHPTASDMAEIVSEMKEYGLKYDPLTLSALYNGFVDLDLPTRADEIEQIYCAAFPVKHVPVKHSAPSRLPSKLRQNDTDGMLAVLGEPPVVETSPRVEDGRDAQSGASGWARLLKRTIGKGHFREADTLYTQARKQGVVLDAPTVHTLMRAVYATRYQAPLRMLSDTAIITTMTLFQDLAEAHPISGRPSPDGPDVSMYTTLLRTLDASRSPQRHFDLAVSLVKDMRARGIPFDSAVLAQCIPFLMRATTGWQDAFEVYSQLAALPGAALDERGFLDVLAAFARLSFGTGVVLPPNVTHYFQIVRDMIDAGHDVTPRVYSFVVARIAQLAARVRKNGRRDEDIVALGGLRDALRRTHHHLTLDASVTPDAVLLNQLMDAYQKLDNLQEAYEVWERMYLAGTCDNVSVSIMLDACGFANRARLAMSIWSQLRDVKFPLNIGNWNAYIECLCRTGYLDDALDVLCLQMGKDDVPEGSVAVQPDVASAQVIVKFAVMAGRVDEAQSRIQQHLPELWALLPDDVTVLPRARENKSEAMR